MNKPLLITLASALLPIFGVSADGLKVKLLSQDTILQYEDAQRLETVLSDAIAHSQTLSPVTYPLANQLFNSNKQAMAQQLKSDVLEQLEQKKQHTGDDTSMDILIEQVKRWTVGYRESLSLDIDKVRIQAEHNPLLAGAYELITPQREEHIQVEGLLFRPQTLAFASATTLSEALDQTDILSTANNSFAWVIYPDGHHVKAGYAYWNNENTHLTPGTVVFVGFNSDDSELQRLEENIVKLISMRKGSQ